MSNEWVGINQLFMLTLVIACITYIRAFSHFLTQIVINNMWSGTGSFIAIEFDNIIIHTCDWGCIEKETKHVGLRVI